MIRASKDGIQGMKEFLAKEEIEREKAIREKNKMTDGFKASIYSYARLTFKCEQLNI